MAFYKMFRKGIEILMHTWFQLLKKNIFMLVSFTTIMCKSVIVLSLAHVLIALAHTLIALAHLYST